LSTLADQRRLSVCRWSNRLIGIALLLPILMSWHYSAPARFYVSGLLLVLMGALATYEHVLTNRIARVNARELRAEYWHSRKTP
jgi:hypothetical protein